MRCTTRRQRRDRIGLPAPIAAELVVAHTRRALLQHWQPSAWLVLAIAVAIAVRRGAWSTLPPWSSAWVLIVGMWGWFALGQWLATDAILAAAHAKAAHFAALPTQHGKAA